MQTGRWFQPTKTMQGTDPGHGSSVQMFFIKTLYLEIALFRVTIWCSGFLFKGSETHHRRVPKWRRQSVSDQGASAAEHLKSGSHPHSTKSATKESAVRALNWGAGRTTPIHSFTPFLSASFSLITSELHQYEK